MLIKLLLVCALLRFQFVGFYRKHPGRNNITSLALESVNVAFAIGTALARAVKLVLISSLYIGRLDTPLLAPGVGKGPLGEFSCTCMQTTILSASLD